MSASGGQQWLRDNALDILDAAVDAIVTINARGIIQSVNRATVEMFGYAADELVGQAIDILLPLSYRGHQDYVER